MPINTSLFSPQTLIIYALTILLGGMYALIAPTLSLYLSQEAGVRPFAVGVFFVGTAMASIIYSQTIAKWSDRTAQRHNLILWGMILGGLACLLFASTKNYWLIVLTGITFFSLSSSVFPQVFALTREYADQNLAPESTTLFNSIVRSCIAIAWVAAPPLGFFLQSTIGFEALYFWVGGFYALVGVVAYYALPRVPRRESRVPALALPKGSNAIWLMVISFTLLFATNHSYLLSLPLLVTQELNAPAYFAGWLMGTAAVLEIPVMLLTGWLANRLGLIGMIRFGCSAAIALYCAVWQAESVWQLFALQILNAIFIGCIAGLGITLFQNMLPGKAGVASTLFTNTNQMGNVVGGLFIAIFADILGYQHMFAVNMLAALIALIALFILKRDQKPQPNHYSEAATTS